MSTEVQQQNESSSSPTSAARGAVQNPVVAVLLASLVGGFLFSLKVQAGLGSISITDHVAVIAADPFGTTMIALLAWFFVGLPAAGGVFLADN